MLKILSSSQTQWVDRQTIEEEPISSIDLMERAAQRCSDWILANITASRSLVIVAGPGNNGGDALAIARIISESNYKRSVCLLDIAAKSADCKANYDRLLASGISVKMISSIDDFDVSSTDVIIDGIFGSGLDRPLQGLALEVVHKINASEALVISIDIPSGMYADKDLYQNQDCLLASHTLCLQFPKLTSLIPSSGGAYGKVHVIDIGLSQKAISEQNSSFYYLESIQEYKQSFSKKKFGHKGTFGHALLVAGGYGKMGASIIANRAAIRSGAGLVTALVPEVGLDVIQSAVPEVMAMVRDDDDLNSKFSSQQFNAIGIGPGIGTDSDALLLFEWVLQHNDLPMVIDADALNLLSTNKKLWPSVPKYSILTPHIKEFERLFGPSDGEVERIELLQTKSKELGLYIVLKGAHTAISTPEGDVIFNSTGNPGMATAGSGDCLTGLITGLLAQTQDARLSALCGVYLHGMAGDIACIKTGQHSLIASDIIDHMGSAIVQTFSFEQ